MPKSTPASVEIFQRHVRLFPQRAPEREIGCNSRMKLLFWRRSQRIFTYDAPDRAPFDKIGWQREPDLRPECPVMRIRAALLLQC